MLPNDFQLVPKEKSLKYIQINFTYMFTFFPVLVIFRTNFKNKIAFPAILPQICHFKTKKYAISSI